MTFSRRFKRWDSPTGEKDLLMMGFKFLIRYGMNNCGSVHSYKELFTHSQSGSKRWQRTEFYFFRCFARFLIFYPFLVPVHMFVQVPPAGPSS